MPPVEAPQTAQDVQVENPLNKKLSGIIYPPPEVRNIVDKTATFVARNGPGFEERIKQNEINNPKFNFLTSTDPYHAYYRHKVKEVMDGGGQEIAISKPSSIPRVQALQDAAKLEVIAEAPPDPEFVADPPSIAAADLDVVKLTAQFVAKNGRSFLTSLMNKEQRNYQFDFLRPQHSLFNYFTKLVEQYTKVLLPSRDCVEKLRAESSGSHDVLRQVSARVAWSQQQQMEKRKEEEAKEKERVSYAQIAWHEFLVVETVDYPIGETGNFPPATTPDDVGARILQQERLDEAGETGEDEGTQPDDKETPAAAEGDMEMEVSDNEESDSDEEKEASATVEMGPPTAAPESGSLQPAVSRAGDIVVRDYDPKSSRQAGPPSGTEQWLISPLTNEKIPAHKLQEHMKISLLDPKWREQKERTIREKSEQETVFAGGANIEANLRQIAERRSDIFGTGLDEAEIGKKLGEEETRGNERMVWDGHSASVDKVSQRARENISIEEQIKVLHQTKGLVEDEAKSRIGPSVTRAQAASTSSVQVRSVAPPPVPRPPISHPPMSVPRPPVAPPPVSHPVSVNQRPIPVQPPPMSSQPVGVPPAPRPIQRPVMMPPTGVMMLGHRPPMPQLPPMLGMPTLGVPAVAPMYRPSMPPAPIAVSSVRPPMDDEPPSKRTKTEESLIPEGQWLAQRPGPVMVKVACPSLPDKPEWKLAGQTLAFTFAPQESCGSIKAKIAEVLGMPSGKQKLQYEGIFIKDQNSLAFYNFLPENVVHLSTKERGGRKK